MALANQVVQEETSPDIDEAKQLGLMAQLVLAKQDTMFDGEMVRSQQPTGVLIPVV
jgi:hypothetical protein